MNLMRCFAFMLLVGSVLDPAGAEPTTRASTAAATAPSAVVAQATSKAAAATQPTTAPTSQISTKLPTPAELVAKLKQMRQQKAARSKVAYIDLARPVTEKPADFSLFGGADRSTLRGIVERLQRARDDKDVRGVLLTLGPEMQMNLAQAQELRDALLELRRAGKKTFVYADSYDTIGYTIASGATNICLLEGGQLMIPGVGLEATFFKGTLDKIGVMADYVQIGEYKGAEEPFTRTSPSEELRGELSRIAESLFAEIVDGISLSRNLSASAVRQMIDETMLIASVAQQRGFVDHLVDQDGLRDLLKDELGNEIELLPNYGQPQKPQLDFSNPLILLAQLSRKPPPGDRPAIALIYAEGLISEGDGEADLFGGGGVGSESMRKALRMAARDSNIKAVVLRIDSPGGSALASEVIWQAIRHVSQDARKPVIVSIGSMAASGGYYLACAGDYIFADRCAIVGSIGVVGGKFVLRGLYDKIGLSSESFNQGRNADLFSSNQAFNERQRRMIRTWMQQTYDQFTQRVMTTRQGKIRDIDKVARGRIFLASQARELGLIDELGGCEAAIARAAEWAELEPGSYDVRVVPPPKTLADIFGGADDPQVEAESMLPFTAPLRPEGLWRQSLLLTLPPSARRQLAQQVQLMQILERRPIALVAPFVVSVK
ncbi:signal peptide peptidase SppA [Fontivita pretiosa]|uniref:signal peptide peptidase SppA n=1 Tax=Fontivita pretiosa TaxID=2989684 RepID=UPI003D16FBA4